MGLGERMVCRGGGLRRGGIAAPYRSRPVLWPHKVDAAYSIGGGFAPVAVIARMFRFSKPDIDGAGTDGDEGYFVGQGCHQSLPNEEASYRPVGSPKPHHGSSNARSGHRGEQQEDGEDYKVHDALQHGRRAGAEG